MRNENKIIKETKLKNLPDISNWDISKVYGMNRMFANCCSVQIWPDISRWNTSNVEYMETMFENCKTISCKFFPDLSKWNVEKVKQSLWSPKDVDSQKIPRFKDRIYFSFEEELKNLNLS